jgi:peptidoglycan-associated lipoprotein
MKKVLFVALILVCVVALAGCHGKKTRPLDMSEEERAKAAERTAAQKPIEKPAEKSIQPIERPEGAEALKDVHFEYDKYNLTDEAASLMAGNAEYLMGHSEIKVLVEGNCDERGTEEYNLALGEKRALAARDYLTRYGIDRTRISIISYGEERPVDPASDEDAWAKNRRDHFVIK